MTFRTMIVAAASTTAAAAASAAVWFAVAPQSAAPAVAPSGQRPPAASTASPGTQDVAIVCVGADQIVRAPQPQGGCPSGQREVSLQADNDAICRLCPPSEKPPETDSSDNQALNDLERRLRVLETAPYFEVVNNYEQPVFRVGPDGVRVFNRSGVAVAAFGASESGGYFAASSGTALVEASMSASGTTVGVQIAEEGLARLSLSAAAAGGSSLRIPSADGVIAGIGASVDGPGALLLGTLDGRVRSSLTVPNGRGMVRVRTDDKGGGLTLLEQAIGGGMFEIDDAKGNSAIKMGHVNNRYGIVFAGPNLGLPLVPKSGLPGSYFMGCGSQAPPACMPSVP